MFRKLLLLSTLLLTWTALPVATAMAQQGGGGGDQDDSDSKKKKRDQEWNLKQAPLPGKRNAGACPFAKVLYDAARYEEFRDNQEATAQVAYTGEIQSVKADCTYQGDQPIRMKLEVSFALGRGPQGVSGQKTYSYWVAVTQRNREVLAKQEFSLPVSFTKLGDRVAMVDRVDGITIPRANAGVAGENFEVLVGFDVTPQMAEFNRLGKRFRINAGAPTQTAQAGGR